MRLNGQTITPRQLGNYIARLDTKKMSLVKDLAAQPAKNEKFCPGLEGLPEYFEQNELRQFWIGYYEANGTLSTAKLCSIFGTNVDEVAEKMGVSRQRLYKIYSGDPKRSTIRRLAEAIGCDIIDLF